MKESQGRIRILMADDHPMFRAGLRAGPCPERSTVRRRGNPLARIWSPWRLGALTVWP